MGYALLTMSDIERRIATIRINIARTEAKLVAQPDGAGVAIALVWLKRDRAELAALLAKVAA
jgi:uncharacterized small protein (DUF1192 family)